MKLALGTVQFGLDYGVANPQGRPSASDVALILQHAAAAGMDTLDTAVAYGDSETVLGRAGVAHWNIVTKLPAVPVGCPSVRGWVKDQVRASLQRLGVQALLGVLLHQPDQILEPGLGPALTAALDELKTNGVTRHVGVSIYSPDELAPLLERWAFDLVQAPLNVLDRRLIESGWAQRLRRSGVHIHTRSAFLQGLLLMAPEQRPAFFLAWAPIWAAWDAWLKDTGLTPLQACLRYACSVQEVDRVVVGVDNPAQLEQIIAASRGPLPPLPDFGLLSDGRLLNPAQWKLS